MVSIHLCMISDLLTDPTFSHLDDAFRCSRHHRFDRVELMTNHLDELDRLYQIMIQLRDPETGSVRSGLTAGRTSSPGEQDPAQRSVPSPADRGTGSAGEALGR